MMRMRSPRSRCVTCAGSSNYQGSGPRGGTNALITRTALIVLLMLVLLPLRTKTLWKRASLKPLRAYATIVVCFLLVGVIISGCGRNRCSGLTPPKKGGTWQWYPTGAIDTGAINLLVPEGCTCRCFYQNRYCWRNKKDGVDCCVDGNNPTAINGTIGTDEKCHCDWPSINPAEGKIPIGGAYEKDSRGEEFNWEQKRI